MVAAILSIGTELTRGEVIDRNGPMLASRLTAMGFDIRETACVADDVDRIAEIVACLADRAAVLVATGGTGATPDDRTVAAVARAVGVGVVRDEATLATIRRRAHMSGGAAADAAERQADVPEGAEVFANPAGLRPAFRVSLGACSVFVLPGEPHEAERVFDEVLARRLARHATARGDQRVLRTLGLDEVALGERLRGVEAMFPGVTIALRAEHPEVDVKVIAREGDASSARALVEAAANEVRGRLGDVVYGSGDDTFAAAVGRQLRARSYTLAVAESCTGGLIGAMLTAVPGSSDYLLLDAVTYANAAKERVLGVEPEILRGHGAVSAECVRAMAEGARRAVRADLAVAVSGVAGPAGGSSEKPVGTVFFAVASARGTTVRRLRFLGDRERVQRQAAWEALAMVREACRGPVETALSAVCG